MSASGPRTLSRRTRVAVRTLKQREAGLGTSDCARRVHPAGSGTSKSNRSLVATVDRRKRMNRVTSVESKMSTMICSNTLEVKRRRMKGGSGVKVRKRILRGIAGFLMKGRQPEKRRTGER